MGARWLLESLLVWRRSRDRDRHITCVDASVGNADGIDAGVLRRGADAGAAMGDGLTGAHENQKSLQDLKYPHFGHFNLQRLSSSVLPQFGHVRSIFSTSGLKVSVVMRLVVLLLFAEILCQMAEDGCRIGRPSLERRDAA